jgi:ASCH domain
VNHRICYAVGCENPVHPEKLMCWGCWKLVSKDLQQAVYQTNPKSTEGVKARQNARTALNTIRTVKHNPIGCKPMIQGIQLDFLKPEATSFEKLGVVGMDQPWATLVALNLKGWETRPGTISWKNYRGRLAIHANKKKGGKDGRELEEIGKKTIEAVRSLGYQVPDLEEMPRGQIICLANFTDCRQMDAGFMALQTTLETAVGNWQVGRLALKLENTICLPTSIPHTGGQGLRYASEELKQRIQEAI